MDLIEHNPADQGVPHERRGGKFVFPATRTAQAMSYLTDAAEAYAAAGDPNYLWRPVPVIYERSTILGPLERVSEAGNRRLRALRSCVILCALALEAYANGFISEYLTAEQIKEIDRETTIRKLTEGPRMAGLETPVDPGGMLANEIRQSFRTRELFVHLRRDEHGAYLQYLTDRDEELFVPQLSGDTSSSLPK